MWDHVFCAGGECRDGPPRPLECKECGCLSSYGLIVHQGNSIYGLLRRVVLVLGHYYARGVCGIYGMSLGHYVIVIAFHLIGSGDGIVWSNGIAHKCPYT